MKEELVTKNAELGLNLVANAMKLILNDTDGQAFKKARKCLEMHTDTIFVCGGRKALCYHPKENMWYRLEDSPFDYPNNTPIQYKSKIYTGSTCNEGMSQVMEYYVPTANTWGAVQSTVETNFTGYTVLKGDLYATCFSTQEGRIYRYDSDTKHWHKMEVSPTIKQLCPCVVSDEQFMYVIGGFTAKTSLSTTTRFDSSNNK